MIESIKQSKNRFILPNAPSLHEEPIRGIYANKEVCKICGKTFKTHSQLDRHMEQMHGHPEETHISPHKM